MKSEKNVVLLGKWDFMQVHLHASREKQKQIGRAHAAFYKEGSVALDSG